jgi:hypothetical protein
MSPDAPPGGGPQVLRVDPDGTATCSYFAVLPDGGEEHFELTIDFRRLVRYLGAKAKVSRRHTARAAAGYVRVRFVPPATP